MNHLQVGDITLNEETFIVTQKGEEVYLTRREFELLAYLMKNKDRVVSKEELLEKVFDGVISINSVEVYVKYVRGKMGTDVIATRTGFGYRLKS